MTATKTCHGFARQSLGKRLAPRDREPGGNVHAGFGPAVGQKTADTGRL